MQSTQAVLVNCHNWQQQQQVGAAILGRNACACLRQMQQTTRKQQGTLKGVQ
jgi:hypothetical protein